MPLQFDMRDLEDTRRQNRRLSWYPRVRLRGLQRFVLQRLMTLAAPRLLKSLRQTGISVEERMIAAMGRTARVVIMRPPGALRGVYLDIHGGGWTSGTAIDNGRMNVLLAKECGVAVVAVDYRLVPEVPFSALLDDCETAAAWLLNDGVKEFGTEQVIISGNSAGAHLAVVTAVRLRDRSPHFSKVIGAVLYYGCYDLGPTDMMRRAGPETLVVHGPTLESFMAYVTGRADIAARRDPAISPLFADLRGMPSAAFIVGTSDPLFDDTRTMHEKWCKVAAADLVVVPEAAHGFNHFGGRTGDKVNGYVRAWVRERLRS